MRVILKITAHLFEETKAQLEQPHAFACERVAFLRCRVGLIDHGLIILSHSRHDVEDGDYIDDQSVGAMMGPSAIRKALQSAYSEEASMFHVHLHSHRGKPHFSHVDERESARFVPDFWNVQPDLPHGAIVLSNDSACGKCWIPGSGTPVEISQFSVVGVPTRKL